MKGKLVYIFFYHGVVLAINKIVFGCLIHYDPEFAADVIFKFVLIAVEVVFGDIGKDRHIGPEGDDVIQLEAADLSHVPFLRIFCDLPGEGIADIPDEGTIQAAMATDMICHGGSRGLTVAAGDADDPAVAFIAISQFDLTDDGDAFLPYLLYQFVLFRNAGAFHDFVGSQDAGGRVMALFEFDAVGTEGMTVFILQRATIGHEDVIAAFGRQYGCTYAALTTTEYDHSLFHVIL